MIVNKDLELYKIMEEALKRYLKAASLISQEGFDLLSKHNGLLWSEITDQIEILEELIREYKIDEPYPQIEESNIGIDETAPKISEITFDANEGIPVSKEDGINSKEDRLINNEYGLIGEEDESDSKEDGPASLFNKVVKYMKRQKCEELQWVRTYSMKCAYGDFEDFQIKYFEHKEPAHQGKNYLFFGNLKKNYTIRRSGDDIVGDTSECFEIILNLSEMFDIDSEKKIS